MTVWKKLIAHAEAKSNACAYLDVDFELCALHVGGAGLEGMVAAALHLLFLAALVVAGSVLYGVESAREQQSTHTNNWAVLVHTHYILV